MRGTAEAPDQIRHAWFWVMMVADMLTLAETRTMNGQLIPAVPGTVLPRPGAVHPSPVPRISQRIIDKTPSSACAPAIRSPPLGPSIMIGHTAPDLRDADHDWIKIVRAMIYFTTTGGLRPLFSIHERTSGADHEFRIHHRFDNNSDPTPGAVARAFQACSGCACAPAVRGRRSSARLPLPFPRWR